MSALSAVLLFLFRDAYAVAKALLYLFYMGCLLLGFKILLCHFLTLRVKILVCEVYHDRKDKKKKWSYYCYHVISAFCLRINTKIL